MKVVVDQLRCQTNGQCVKLCPQLFRFQAGSKKSMALKEEVPLELEEQCRVAARACPREAIIISE